MLLEEARILRHEQRAAALVQAAEGENHFERRRSRMNPKRQRDGQQKQRIENIGDRAVRGCGTGGPPGLELEGIVDQDERVIR